MTRLREPELLARYFAPLADNEVARGLRDDAACYAPPAGFELVISTDALVTGVHFPLDELPSRVATRLMAATMSDLAAKGAQAEGVLMTLGLASDWGDAWLAGFAEGLARELKAYAVALWGGDTVAHKGAGFLSLTGFGLVPVGKMVRRDGARVGDAVYVSGAVGAGLLSLQGGEIPRPPMAFGVAMRGLASAACDLSDGLLLDAENLARASGVVLELDAEAVPLAGEGDAVAMMSGGEDWQIILTAPNDAHNDLVQSATDCATQLTRIGRVVSGDGGRGVGSARCRRKRDRFRHGRLSARIGHHLNHRSFRPSRTPMTMLTRTSQARAKKAPKASLSWYISITKLTIRKQNIGIQKNTKNQLPHLMNSRLPTSSSVDVRCCSFLTSIVRRSVSLFTASGSVATGGDSMRIFLLSLAIETLSRFRPMRGNNGRLRHLE